MRLLASVSTRRSIKKSFQPTSGSQYSGSSKGAAMRFKERLIERIRLGGMSAVCGTQLCCGVRLGSSTFALYSSHEIQGGVLNPNWREVSWMLWITFLNILLS